MTEKSAQPIWAKYILREVANPEIAHRLIIDLMEFMPLLRQLVTHFNNTTPIEQSKANARRQLSRIRRQAAKLRESLTSIESHAHDQIIREEVLINAENENETGNSTDGSWDSVSSLTDALEDVISVLDASIVSLSTSPGHPKDNTRDFLIRSVALVFGKMAPDIEVSGKLNSLFYRVVDQYLSDFGLESQNLNRSLNRLIADGVIP